MKRFCTLISCAIFGFFIGCILYLLPNAQIGHVCAPTIYDINTENDITTSTKDSVYTISPYTGEPLLNKSNNLIPFLCVIDNSRNSRPQSGLSEADILYEHTLEDGIPKFLALYYKNSPIKIGPIINTDNCFIGISQEYELPFAHNSESADVLATISNDVLSHDINKLSQAEYFWKDNSRISTDNFYTSSTNIKNFIKSSNVFIKPNCSLTFDKATWLDSYLENATELSFNLSENYQTSYRFINGTYEKYMDGILANDLNDNTPLTFTNIILQVTNINKTFNSRQLKSELIGSGEGLIFSNGKVQKMHWIKSNESSPTILTNLNGELLPLTPGNTIWHIADVSSKICYK